tara:strand:- start:30476 stop:30832 length:357 start_codon:yes stop_codon:yes gene_type:complete
MERRREARFLPNWNSAQNPFARRGDSVLHTKLLIALPAMLFHGAIGSVDPLDCLEKLDPTALLHLCRLQIFIVPGPFDSHIPKISAILRRPTYGKFSVTRSSLNPFDSVERKARYDMA